MHIIRKLGLRLTVGTGLAVVMAVSATAIVQAETTTVTDPAEQPRYTTAGEASAAAKERAAALKAEAEKRAEAARAKAAEAKTRAQERSGKKLEEVKLRVCQKREATINNLMTRLGNRGQKQLDMISTTSERLQAYKESKGLTVANYDSLLATTEAQKLAAQAAVDAAKSVQGSFKCDGSDPKSAADSFKQAMKVQHDAIKAYRDSVKELLTAIKQAQAADSVPAPNQEASNE